MLLGPTSVTLTKKRIITMNIEYQIHKKSTIVKPINAQTNKLMKSSKIKAYK